MSDGVKSSAQQDRGGKVDHRIWWEPEDMERIEAAAEKLGAHEHLDLTATDIIRKGTRALCEQILGPKAA